MRSTRDLVTTHHAAGEVRAVVVRPDRRVPARTVASSRALAGRGLADDRHARRAPGSSRQVTLVQAEHLPVIAALAGLDTVTPVDLRRNLVVAGVNLSAVRGRQLRIGDAVLEVTGPCHPCSRMEEALGPGGFQAMRGHGGMTARVVADGEIAVGAAVHVVPPNESPDESS